MLAIRDEVLRSVEDPVGPVWDGGRLDVLGIRARVRLGQREAHRLLSGHERNQVVLLLLVCAGEQHAGGTLGPIRGERRESASAPGRGLAQQDHPQLREIAATEILREVRGVEAELGRAATHAIPELDGYLVLLSVQLSILERAQLPVDEIRDATL